MATSIRIGGAALLTGLLGTTALADVTPEQVWADWQDYLAQGDGGTVSAGPQSMSNGTLIVNGVTVTNTDAEGEAVLTIDRLSFAENGDGTVSIEMSEALPLTVTATDETGQDVTIAMTIAANGQTVTASGTPQEIAYDLAADSYVLTVDSVTPDDNLAIDALRLALEGIEASWISQAGDLQQIDAEMTARMLTVAVDVADTVEGSSFVLNGTVEDIAAQATLALPDEAEMETPAAAIAAGLEIDGGYTYGPAAYAFSFDDSVESGEGTAAAAGGDLTFGMGPDGLAYAGSALGQAISFTAQGMPVPIDISIAESAYSLTLPIAPTDAPADFALQVGLTDLALNDEVWAMFDPQGVLPRDPATLALDLSGTVRMLFDAMDPARAEAMRDGEMPYELHALTLNDLTLRAAGVEVTGQGDFTFDPDDTQTFPGFPAPTGSATLRVSGANALIDDLIELGVVPRQQAMGARMMLGAFATPVGDDTLESTIEVTGDGQVLANGQRIQ